MIDFNKFYIENFSEFVRYAKTMVIKSDVSEDITQESFIKLSNSMCNISKDKHYPWLKSVIRNKCIDYHRSKFKNMFISSDINTLNRVIDNDEHMCESEKDSDKYTMDKYIEVMQHVDKLSTSYKSIFMMHEIDKKTHKEIALELKINIGTSKSNLHRARESLRKMIKHDKII